MLKHLERNDSVKTKVRGQFVQIGVCGQSHALQIVAPERIYGSNLSSAIPECQCHAATTSAKIQNALAGKIVCFDGAE